MNNGPEQYYVALCAKQKIKQMEQMTQSIVARLEVSEGQMKKHQWNDLLNPREFAVILHGVYHDICTESEMPQYKPLISGAASIGSP